MVEKCWDFIILKSLESFEWFSDLFKNLILVVLNSTWANCVVEYDLCARWSELLKLVDECI